MNIESVREELLKSTEEYFEGVLGEFTQHVSNEIENKFELLQKKLKEELKEELMEEIENYIQVNILPLVSQ